jgi:hypothetical protein
MFMARRALFSPGFCKQNLALMVGLGAAFVMLGCGGGGGGGGGPQNPGQGAGDCGSAPGTNQTVICGYVVDNANTTVGVNGAIVTLKNAAGQTVGTPATTVNNPATGTNGFFKFVNIPAGATMFQVEGPGPTYFTNTSTFNGKTYANYLTFQGTNTPCLASLVIANANADNNIGNVRVHAVNAGPPPFPTGCFP